jgi:hypothetical protein
MDIREIVGFLTGFLILAGLTVAIVNGGNTANIFTAAGNAFATDIKAATLQG